MDIVSHGLWGSLAFGRTTRRDFWLAFFFGIAPDLFSFGPYAIGTWLGLFPHPNWRSGEHPDPANIPAFVHQSYDVTHSLVVFLVVFGIVWIVRRRPWWVLGAWGLHILVDIPTHSDAFFPTPLLWPLSDFHVSGIPWSHPAIFIPNIVSLLFLYGVYFWYRRRSKIS